MNRKLEVVLVIVSIASVVSSVGFVYLSAQNMYRIAKPLIVELEPVPPTIKLKTFSFVYEPNTDRYTGCIVELTNIGDANFTAKVTIMMFDELYNLVARGEHETNPIIRNSNLSFEVILVWTETMTVRDFTAATITLQEFAVQQEDG